MAMLLVVGGYGAIIVGGIWLLVKAFTESIVWGLLCLFIPIAGLIFVITHWEDAKSPFLLQVAGIVLVVVAVVLGARDV
jgi:hypothetical protein